MEMPSMLQFPLAAAVLAACGFSEEKDLLAQFLCLDLEVAAQIERREPVTATCVPKICPNAKQLVTADCVQPPTI